MKDENKATACIRHNGTRLIPTIGYVCDSEHGYIALQDLQSLSPCALLSSACALHVVLEQRWSSKISPRRMIQVGHNFRTPRSRHVAFATLTFTSRNATFGRSDHYAIHQILGVKSSRCARQTSEARARTQRGMATAGTISIGEKQLQGDYFRARHSHYLSTERAVECVDMA